MQKSQLIETAQLIEEPYALTLCYPKSTALEVRRRTDELHRLGITALEFTGKKVAFTLPILGKGHVGIVTLAYRGNEKVALKIRRVDSDRANMQNEAELLARANLANVGPKLLAVSKNFLLMQLIDGATLPAWLENQKPCPLVREVFREVLEQCWRLDQIGLDHGELSHAPRHVLINVGDTPFIVDFETASLNRRPSNVTSICQYLFLSNQFHAKTAPMLSKTEKCLAVEALRAYKHATTLQNFEAILRIFDL